MQERMEDIRVETVAIHAATTLSVIGVKKTPFLRLCVETVLGPVMTKAAEPGTNTSTSGVPIFFFIELV